jgi:hypothetical protein
MRSSRRRAAEALRWTKANTVVLLPDFQMLAPQWFAIVN